MADPEFDTLKRNVEWRSMFPATNAAQRQRENQDIQALTADLLGQQEAQMIQEARTNKTAQDFFFRQRDMERRAEMDSFTRGLRQAEEERKSELFPIQKEVEQAKLNAQVALEKMRLNKEKRDAESALRVATDTDAFESKVGQLMQTHRPGSKEFAEGLLGIVSTHPYVPSDIRKTWMSQADIDTDPDQLMRDTEKFRSTHDTTLKVNDKGKWTVALSEKKPVSTTPSTAKKADSYEQFNKDLKAMVEAFGGEAKVPKEKWAEFEARKAAIGTPAATPAATSQSQTPSVAPVSAPSAVTSKADYDALPSGSEFTWNGRRGKKP